MTVSATQYSRSARVRTCLTGVLLTALLGACGGSSSGPEEELRQWVNNGETLAEEKNRRALMAKVSTAYVDARGFERDDIEKMLRVYFFRQNSVELLVSITELRVFSDSAAEVELTIGFAGTNDGTLGFSASAYKFELELEKAEDEWLLISARWGEIGEELK